MLNRYAIIALVLALIAVASFVSRNQDEIISNFKCPEEYSSPDEYVMDMAKSLSEYIKHHPESSQEELLEERQRLFDARGCKGWTEAEWNKQR